MGCQACEKGSVILNEPHVSYYCAVFFFTVVVGAAGASSFPRPTHLSGFFKVLLTLSIMLGPFCVVITAPP